MNKRVTPPPPDVAEIFDAPHAREEALQEIGRRARMMFTYAEAILLGVEAGDFRLIRSGSIGAREHLIEIGRLQKVDDK